MDDLDKRIAEANDEFISDEEEPVSREPGFVPSDLFQARQEVQRDYGKKQFPHGSRALVLATAKDVINGVGTDSLAQAYERAKDDSEVLEKMGNVRRAQLVREQYMQEHFLPAVEVVVNFTSPDELLNSKEGLAAFDEFVLGSRATSGYTAAYVRSAYESSLGQAASASSPKVQDTVSRLHGLLDSDQMTIAYGLARRVKREVDEGRTIASEKDYNFLSRVANNRLD